MVPSGVPPDSPVVDLIERIDQLRRSYPIPLRPAPVTRSASCYLWRIHGVGLTAQHHVPTNEQPRSAGESILVGLAATSTPFAMVIDGVGGRVRIDMGVWHPEGWSAPERLSHQHDVLAGLLEGMYAEVDYQAVAPSSVDRHRFTEAGLAFGVPTLKAGDVRGDANQIDRLIRSLRGATWRAVVLAQPVDEHYITELRNQLIGEMRSVGTTMASMFKTSVGTPLEEHYTKYQAQWLEALREGLDRGMWRVAVYLLGDDKGYARLAAAWRAIFSGEKSMPEPVRVVHDRQAIALAGDWAMPDTFASGGSPTRFVPPFEHQTLLSSPQLSAFVDLPRQETTGFAVNLTANFDSVTPTLPPSEPAVSLGPVVERGIVIAEEYAVPLHSLTRHTFVAGITGTGKTNTLFHLIKQADRHGAAFLVLEPAKREYRSLLADPDLRRPPRVLTLGDERLAPLRLNPFEPEPDTPLNVHLDLLRSLFGVSLGMWTPLPQVLERALHTIYAEHGWDIATGLNHRLAQANDHPADGASSATAMYPTLTDLLAAVEEIVPTLGYGREVEGNVLGALRTRLGSLRAGGKGRMLDTPRSLPMSSLLGRSTVLELEPLGDDDDKAFVMGLLLLRLAEYRRHEGPKPALRHLLVIEEAHRLLRNTGAPGREEAADPRGKAVETFSNLLAEVRSYGQGVIVTDQVPSKLAPDVIKNTTLKVAHRIVANDDRAVMGGAMAMDELQMRTLASLVRGRAAVFGGGDDAPVLVQVPRAKGDGFTDDAVVAAQRRDAYAGQDALLSGCQICAEAAGFGRASHTRTGADNRTDRLCEVARHLADGSDLRAVVARMAASMAEDGGARRRLWSDVEAAVLGRRPPDLDADSLCRAAFAHAAARVAARWGAERGWTYGLTDALRAALVEAVIADDDSAAARYRTLSLQAHEVDVFPFPGCEAVCGNGSIRRCRYRHAVAPVARASEHREAYETAVELDYQEPRDEPLSRTWEVATKVANDVVEFPSLEMEQAEADAARQRAFRVGLCAAQHLLTGDDSKPWSVRRDRINLVMEVYA